MIRHLRRRLDGSSGPYFVLATAILLPGFGHVLVGKPRRGFTMQMFMIAGAFITWHLSTPAQSLVGRLAGGLFVYAISIPEAYRLAKLQTVRRGAVQSTTHVAPHSITSTADLEKSAR